MNNISLQEYRRQVFNHSLLECFGKIQLTCCEIDPKEEPHVAKRAKAMSDEFYKGALDLDTSTVDKVKAKLKDASSFIKDCVCVCEAVADMKSADAQVADIEMYHGQTIELSPEDKEMIDKLFVEKNPDVQIDQIRDGTVKALLAEDKKAKEIRDSLDIANSQVATGANPNALEETVNRISSVGPTSLMNAIMNSVAGLAVKDVNENSKTIVSVDKVMSENAQEIKNRAVMMYSLYEAASVFGVLKFTEADIKHEAEKIYYNK